MKETEGASPRLPVTTWAPYTGPGGARGVGLFDADGNIIAGLHKHRGGASNLGIPVAIYRVATDIGRTQAGEPRPWP
jgi:hypothetical protein